MNIVPVFNNVVLKEQEKEKETKTKGGLILTNSSQTKQELFTVVAVGNGVLSDGTEVPMVVKVGDKVLLPSYQSNKVTVDDEDYIIVSQSAILAIVE